MVALPLPEISLHRTLIPPILPSIPRIPLIVHGIAKLLSMLLSAIIWALSRLWLRVPWRTRLRLLGEAKTLAHLVEDVDRIVNSAEEVLAWSHCEHGHIRE